MDLLPTNDEQRFLIHGLYDLVEQRGPQTFVAAPILEPTSRFFPDHWEPSAEGVHTLLLRLLAYAGLGDLHVEVHLFEDPTRVAASWDAATRHRGVAGWFAGIEDGVCRFGVDASRIGNPEGLTGVLCHEVAHAYRAHHGLEIANRSTEERLTDLTTIFLGFGVLTVNNTDRYRARGGGDYRVVTWESAGYLSPQAMSFLLAAQVAARRLGARERRRIEGLLEPNQAACFVAAWEQLAPDPDKLARRLGLPPRETWPAARPIEEIVGSAREAPPRDDEGEGGHAVRVLRRSRALYVLLGVVAGIVMAVVAGGQGVRGEVVLFLFVAGVAAGIALGVWVRTDRCSACLHPLRRRPLEECPGCGRPLRGVIDASGRATPKRAPAEKPEPPVDLPEAPSEMDAHLARLRAVPAIARAHREGDAMELHRLLRKRRDKAKSLAEGEAIDWLLRDPRPRLRKDVRRPPLRAIFSLHDVGHHDPADGSDVAILWLELVLPIVPLASYVVRHRAGGEVEILGRVPLEGARRIWRGLAAAIALSPLLWIVPAIAGGMRGTVHFVNGLDVPVVVSISGERITLGANDRDRRVLGRGRHRATVADERGNVIEQQEVTVRGGDHFVAYNVLGAAMLVTREVVYGPVDSTPAPAQGERHLHRRIVEREDITFPFTEPPLRIGRSGSSRLWAASVVPGGWRLSAATLESEGGRAAAAELVTAVSLAQPFDEQAIFRALDTTLASGGSERALAHVARVLERAPSSEPAHLARQEVLRRAGRIAEAREVYRKMQVEQPGSALAACLRARVEPAEARLRLLPDLAREHPSSGSIHALFGRTLLGAGRPAEAVAELDRASELAPGDARHWADLHARALVALGRAADAAARVASIVGSGADVQSAVLYARVAKVEGPRPTVPPEEILARVGQRELGAAAPVLLAIRIGDVDAVRSGLAGIESGDVRRAAEISIAADTDPNAARVLVTDATPGAIGLLDPALRFLLGAELARVGHAEAASRVLATLAPIDDPAALEDLARGRPSAIGLRDLPLALRAALRFAEARRRGARGEELEAARREARALDVLPGPLRRAIDGWPAP